jgi:hypothetical protein
VFGSGTQGLQRRTLSPPPRLSNSEELPARAGSNVGRRARELGALNVSLSVGGWTMNWYGIVIRCGEQALQTTRPHFLPTWFRFVHISRGKKCLTCNGACEQRSQLRSKYMDSNTFLLKTH